MEIYKTSGVCASEIHFEIKDGTIENVTFVGGCPGNALGVSALVKGLKIEEAISRLKGIDCRGRGTSCPDQLTRALEAYLTK
ncbi:MAG: TIGR03905 family TSCPD domain-containing protein [Cellulosilyticum sp.]|nr:TIGR03905 family TSCPD domain-containing protein [Cellulosilyticum sp.]